MANPLTPGPLFSGAADLIGALSGGAGIEEKARQTEQARLIAGQSAEATLDKKITDAYLARDQRQAQQSYKAKLMADGVPEAAADVGATFAIGGNANLEQVQKYGLRSQATTALQADPNFTPANALLTALTGDPVKGVVDVSGQNVTGIYGNAPVITNSDSELSVIAANAARAGASNAQANASNARAGVSNVQAAAGGWNPNTGGGGGGGAPAGGKPVAYTSPPMNALMAALDGDADGKLTPEEKAKFQTWRAGRPDLRNGAEALSMYEADLAAAASRRQFPGMKPATQAMTITAKDGTVINVPAGQDPQLVAEMYDMQRDAQKTGDPLSLGALRAAATLRAKGYDYSIAGSKVTAIPKPVKGNQPSPIEPTSAAATARPANKAAFDRLPSGTRFIDPNGVTRIKP